MGSDRNDGEGLNPRAEKQETGFLSLAPSFSKALTVYRVKLWGLVSISWAKSLRKAAASAP